MLISAKNSTIKIHVQVIHKDKFIILIRKQIFFKCFLFNLIFDTILIDQNFAINNILN